jgi:hypothetical protein
MINFTFHIPTKIYFGKGEENRVGEYLKPYAKKVLLHYGSGSIKRSGLYDRVCTSLKKAGIDWVELGGVVPNPRVDLVREGIALCHKEGVDFVLAVGGGSAIDSAKAIAAGAVYDGDVWELFQSAVPTGKALPVATILTIPAAGSESSKVSVISNEENLRKIGYHDEALRPKFSIINPALFFTLPKEQIAYGVADMMSHIFERYFTHTTHTDITDELCEGVLRAVIKNAVKVYGNPENYEAWCEIGFAGALAHNDLLGRGRAECWGCHGMEHELSAIYDVAHGAGLAVVTPFWMEHVWRLNPGIFAQFAQNVMGVAPHRDTETVIKTGIARLREFFARLGLPATLTDLGIPADRLEEMAKTTGAWFGEEKGRGGFKKLVWQDVLAIYEMAR